MTARDPHRRVITLPNGCAVSLATYVKAWRALREMEPDRLVEGFGHFAERADDILRTMRAGIHDRINRHDPRPRGQWGTDPDRARHLRQLAHRINSRAIVREAEMPLRWRGRVAHRLHRPDDF